MFAYCNNSPANRIDSQGATSEEAADELIEDNKDAIIAAGDEFGVDPAIIAGCIYAEQVMNVDWIDTLTDVPCFWADTSIGIGQVKVSTAILLEDAGYLPKTEGHWYSPRSLQVALKLTNEEYNIRCVAAYLKYWTDQWEDTLNIARKADILGTLYNLGDNAREPNTSPKSNDFGRKVGSVYGKMHGLLYVIV